METEGCEEGREANGKAAQVNALTHDLAKRGYGDSQMMIRCWRTKQRKPEKA